MKVREALKSRLARDFLTVFSGSSLAQLIPLVVSPILSRMYDPAQFGALGFFLSIASVLLVVSTLQYESAIILPKEDSNAKAIVVICLLALSFVALLSFLVPFLMPYIGEMGESELLIEYVLFLPLFVIIGGLFNIQKYWAIRFGKYSQLSLRYVLRSLGQALTKLLLGLQGFFNWGLFIGSFIGQVIGMMTMLPSSIKSWVNTSESITKVQIRDMAVKYIHFPKYTMPHAFFDVFAHTLILGVVGAFYGVEVVGFYSFTLGILKRPIELIGSALSDVLLGDLSKKKREGSLIRQIVLKVLVSLGVLGVLGFLPIVVWGEHIFTWVFSEKWRDAGLLASALAPLLFFRFIANPLSRVTVVLEKQRQAFLFSLVYNVLYPSTIVVLSLSETSFIQAFSLASMVFSLYFMVYILWILRLVRYE